MQQFILDGYNIIHKIPELEEHLGSSLESARMALAGLAAEWKSRHARKCSICIVFDAKGGSEDNDEFLRGIKCVYAKGGADDRIISMVKSSKAPSNIVVVSSDNYVINNCSAHGATTQAVNFLLEKTKPKIRHADEKLSPSAEREINEFLKKKWNL